MTKRFLVPTAFFIAAFALSNINNLSFSSNLTLMANSTSTEVVGCESTMQGTWCHVYSDGTGACFFNGHLGEYCKKPPVETKPTM